MPFSRTVNRFKTESEMAINVVNWLQDFQWDVYQEVAIGMRVADIVAVRKNIIWVIECKLHFGLEVIEQAFNWTWDANYVSIATPYSRRNTYDFGSRILRLLEIGRLSIAPDEVREIEAPTLHRKSTTNRIVSSLRQEQKTFAKAGTKSGHWTPFKQTCRDLEFYVSHHEGCTLKESISNIETHYSTPASARNNIKDLIENGVIKGLALKKDNGVLRIYTSKTNREIENAKQ